jgi:hypothetical protein
MGSCGVFMNKEKKTIHTACFEIELKTKEENNIYRDHHIQEKCSCHQIELTCQSIISMSQRATVT